MVIFKKNVEALHTEPSTVEPGESKTPSPGYPSDAAGSVISTESVNSLLPSIPFATKYSPIPSTMKDSAIQTVAKDSLIDTSTSTAPLKKEAEGVHLSEAQMSPQTKIDDLQFEITKLQVS